MVLENLLLFRNEQLENFFENLTIPYEGIKAFRL